MKGFRLKQGTILTKGERTQQKILEAAKGLFLSQGYTATSIRQIAGTVGITPAAIYTHFSGKEQIFNILLEQAAPFAPFLAVFESLKGDHLEDCIENTFCQIVELLSSHHDYIRLALIDAQERSGASLRSFLPKLFPAGLAYHQHLLELESAGSKLRGLSPFLFMRALICMIGGYMMTERVMGTIQHHQLADIDWAHGLVDIFLNGVLEIQNEGA
jgi:AcrR family transcriptional regulator